jgi:hypothetical protein
LKTDLLPDETLLKDGAANLHRGLDVVGGWLYMTDRRLIFEATPLNFDRSTTIIELPSITGTQKCWTLLWGSIPIFPNAFAVFTTDGKEYRFVSSSRQAWIEAIEGQTP